MSKTKVHQQFKVSRSTIDDWLKLRQETGKVEAKRDYCRGCPPALGGTVEVRTFIEAHKHSTLTEMVQKWQQERGATLSTMAFSRALKRHGYSRKKRAISTGSVR